MGPEGSMLKLSENGNDFWALDNSSYKNNGYFVDLGAGDGITGSNTFILEKFYKWNGLCVDPNPTFLKSLCGSRDVLISDLAVSKESGKVVDFKYLAQNRNEFFGWNFRSGISSNVDDTSVNFDNHKVFTITLTDLLDLYKAPKEIDYISIDIEGSEIDALEGFDFNKYHVRSFSIEFNNDNNRKKGFEIMKNNQYVTVDSTNMNEDRFIKQLFS